MSFVQTRNFQVPADRQDIVSAELSSLLQCAGANTLFFLQVQKETVQQFRHQGITIFIEKAGASFPAVSFPFGFLFPSQAGNGTVEGFSFPVPLCVYPPALSARFPPGLYFFRLLAILLIWNRHGQECGWDSSPGQRSTGSSPIPECSGERPFD